MKGGILFIELNTHTYINLTRSHKRHYLALFIRIHKAFLTTFFVVVLNFLRCKIIQRSTTTLAVLPESNMTRYIHTYKYTISMTVFSGYSAFRFIILQCLQNSKPATFHCNVILHHRARLWSSFNSFWLSPTDQVPMKLWLSGNLQKVTVTSPKFLSCTNHS